MASTARKATDITALVLVGGAAFLLYQLFKSFNATAQGVSDWFTGNAVYDAFGNRIPLSDAAQQVLNAANILPVSAETDTSASNTGPTTVVKALDTNTGQTLYVDPATGNFVT